MINFSNNLKSGLIVALLATTFSCKKDDSTAPEPTITINIQSPTEGAVLQHGDTLLVKAYVNSPVQLHGYIWKLIDKASNQVLASGEDHVHELNFDISGMYGNMVTDTINAELSITAEVDHDGDEVSEKVNVTLYP